MLLILAHHKLKELMRAPYNRQSLLLCIAPDLQRPISGLLLSFPRKRFLTFLFNHTTKSCFRTKFPFSNDSGVAKKNFFVPQACK
ncbi:hypothetical protein CISIN_1g044006mg [Citrus sinensis]|uniref:Uncharacterized protein n=1 Tax=Citrus sinensis TaxID=2711 RepID=A0A067DSX4_CITSI|nr:hypothetical protein CISIN_1g044006mg [Citrus sinensis]